MEAVFFSETVVSTYESTLRHNPERLRPEHGDSIFLRNTGIYLRVYTASQHRRTSSSSALKMETEFFSETVVSTYESTRHNSPEQHRLFPQYPFHHYPNGRSGSLVSIPVTYMAGPEFDALVGQVFVNLLSLQGNAGIVPTTGHGRFISQSFQFLVQCYPSVQRYLANGVEKASLNKLRNHYPLTVNSLPKVSSMYFLFTSQRKHMPNPPLRSLI
jgi:hypothetical protein